jgi:hypothetical protein
MSESDMGGIRTAVLGLAAALVMVPIANAYQ